MSHVFTIAAGDFRARFVRYLLTALVIAVGVALLVALTAVSDATRDYVEQTLYRVYPADIMMYSDSINIPQYFVDVLQKNAVVESAEGIIMYTGTYGGVHVSIVGVPLAAMGYFAIELDEGRLPAAGGEAVVEESLGLKPGDVIKIKMYSGISGSEKIMEVRVVGTMRSFMRGFVGAFRLNLVVVPLDWLQRQLDVGPFVNAILITLKDKQQVSSFHAMLKEQYRDAQVYTQTSLLNTVSQVFNALNTVFAVISAAALVTAAITTLAVMSITTNERMREFGLLKAMGISSRDILTSVLLEVTTVAGVAAVVGMIVGYAGANVVKDMLIKMGINFYVPISFKPHYAALSFSVSLLVALVGAMWPLLKIAKLRPLEIMRL